MHNCYARRGNRSGHHEVALRHDGLDTHLTDTRQAASPDNALRSATTNIVALVLAAVVASSVLVSSAPATAAASAAPATVRAAQPVPHWLPYWLKCLVLGKCDAAPTNPRYLTDDNGRSLILHGINVSNAIKSDPTGMGWTEQGDLDRLADDFGFNFVRWLIPWDVIEPEPGVIDDDYFAALRERLDWLWAKGIHVVLDMHQDMYAEKLGGNGAPDWAVRTDGWPDWDFGGPWWLKYLSPSVIRAFSNFWQEDGPHGDLQDHYEFAWTEVARRVGDHPGVVGYDLMNEPYWGTKGIQFESTELSPFYQRMINAIREVDADNWIFYEPIAFTVANFGLPSGLTPLDDPRPGEDRLAYFPHFYPLLAHEGLGYDGPIWAEIWAENRVKEVNRQGAPLLIGEWGSPNQPGIDDLIIDTANMADRATSGWTYWSYDRCCWFLDGNGGEQPFVKYLVRVFAREIAGTPVSHDFDPVTREFTLVFDDTAGITGPTRIYIPESRHYPDGWTLDVADPHGTWSSSWDADTEILEITTDSSLGRHEIRISPAADGD